MEESKGFGRREFLKSAVAGGAAAASAGLSQAAQAQQQPSAAQPSAAAGYAYLNLDEAAFVEALVDHMVPGDGPTPKGTVIGINIYIDRALAGSWGKGDRLYMQGPWKPGVPEQGYQLPLTPAELYRAGIAATNRHCVKTYGKPFDKLAEGEREEVLKGLDSGKLSFDGGLSSRVFFSTVYQTVMEGLFADPIYGGNRDKAGWKMVGFPGVVAVHQQNIVKFKDKRFPGEPTSIADMS
ncbi:MAG TPA: gluconate 2-dehydrogenase subunit 3 family protein [Burkholderiales bacterium]|nr:gluconate 2-dehydrogenase subunit 3 family protein [Burkholderiales bacterium]